ncbi:hypothetical protein BOX15_Mlig014016g1, partial [Macrostomum lignano]
MQRNTRLLVLLILGLTAAARASSDCRHEPCQHGGVCTAGSLTCACPQGFVGDRCELPDPCQHSPCHPASACVVNSTSWGFQCLCPSGFVGDTCSIDVNECLSAPCANGGSCVNTEGGYSCQCPASFEGRHCELPLSPSRPSTAIDCRLNGGCYNGGVCSGDFDGKCRCVNGFSGERRGGQWRMEMGMK